MNFHWPFLSKPEPAPVRFIVATKAESLMAQRKRADIRIELAIYKATTTPEQRKAENDAFVAAYRSTIDEQRKGRG